MLARILVVLSLLVGLAGAAEEPKSKLVRDAKVAYEKELARLDKFHKEAKQKAVDGYLEKLDAAMKNALIKDQVDEANRIAQFKKTLAEGKPTAPTATPAKQKAPWFVGTEWKSHSEPLAYRWTKDGYQSYRGGVANKTYVDGRLVMYAPWIQLNQNTVMSIWQGDARTSAKTYCHVGTCQPI